MLVSIHSDFILISSTHRVWCKVKFWCELDKSIVNSISTSFSSLSLPWSFLPSLLFSHLPFPHLPPSFSLRVRPPPPLVPLSPTPCSSYTLTFLFSFSPSSPLYPYCPTTCSLYTLAFLSLPHSLPPPLFFSCTPIPPCSFYTRAFPIPTPSFFNIGKNNLKLLWDPGSTTLLCLDNCQGKRI